MSSGASLHVDRRPPSVFTDQDSRSSPRGRSRSRRFSVVGREPGISPTASTSVDPCLGLILQPRRPLPSSGPPGCCGLRLRLPVRSWGGGGAVAVPLLIAECFGLRARQGARRDHHLGDARAAAGPVLTGRIFARDGEHDLAFALHVAAFTASAGDLPSPTSGRVGLSRAGLLAARLEGGFIPGASPATPGTRTSRALAPRSGASTSAGPGAEESLTSSPSRDAPSGDESRRSAALSRMARIDEPRPITAPGSISRAALNTFQARSERR
jgi:hypothetical protein